jgi:membrane peptidoglycan carboxypeptidase
VSEGHRKPNVKAPRPKAHWALRLLGWLAALFFLGVIGLAAIFFIGYKLTDIPDPNKDFQTNTTFVYYADGKPIGSFSEQNRLSVDLKTIPKYTQDAHIAAEDRTFWTNPGIEPTAMIRAGWNIARGQDLQGGSTITQQYVKLMYLTQERTVTRKFKELFISIKLSRSDDKAQILEDYLNTIYYGRGAYGIRAAGKAFYNKDLPKQLTVGESALLATILNNPSAFNPDEPANKQRILERYRYVLSGMREMGTITAAQEAQLRKAYPQPIPETKSNKYTGPNGFLLDMARRNLIKAGFSEEEINGGGLRVKTTFDSKLQQLAVKAVNEEHPDKTKDLHIGLASVRPETGELVAMYGGPDYLKSQLNWATARARPGSSFKSFAVAAALKDGKSLRDTYQGNSPIEINGEEFGNEFDEDYGRVSLLEATEKSINTAFYDLVDNDMEDGPSKLVDAAEAAGIPKTQALENDRNAPATVLGPNAYASPVDMASAYGTFAANGVHADLRVLKEVRDSTGKVLLADKAVTNRVFDEEVAADTTYALEKVVTDGTGASTASKIDRPAGGKTGTAGGTAVEKRVANAKCAAQRKQDPNAGCKMMKENEDTLTSWWVGFTPQLSTAVLYRAGKSGESDLDPYSGNRAFFGGTWPARTWLAYMEPAHDGLEVEDFPEPSKKNREPSKTPRDDRTFTPSQPPSLPPSMPTPSQPTFTPKPTGKPKPTKPGRTPTPTFPGIPTTPAATPATEAAADPGG